ncbi:hypothetical protein CALVIDRAFT_334814 [Calocera viscosa TUFC12733]|uniref:Uncharacterized protein n=1 Tax=Calocera viscosa (strain TUFC12733) TaxID=1330018 RepID=A0A167HM06_CALVF|nr:hypothetical protein CALVIDRAFT_334814 [Calocera viscosa TUFC12733]
MDHPPPACLGPFRLQRSLRARPRRPGVEAACPCPPTQGGEEASARPCRRGAGAGAGADRRPGRGAPALGGRRRPPPPLCGGDASRCPGTGQEGMGGPGAAVRPGVHPSPNHAPPATYLPPPPADMAHQLADHPVLPKHIQQLHLPLLARARPPPPPPTLPGPPLPPPLPNPHRRLHPALRRPCPRLRNLARTDHSPNTLLLHLPLAGAARPARVCAHAGAGRPAPAAGVRRS